jgi:hypothetical protein
LVNFDCFDLYINNFDRFDLYIDNYRMNYFKSAFSSSKNEQFQRSFDQLYEDVKSWDGARAQSLQNHLKVV